MGWLAPAARAAVLERVAVVVPDGVLDEAVARPVEPVLGNGHVLTACVDRELAETASTGRYRVGVVKSAVSTHRPDVLDTRAAQGVIAFKGASRPTCNVPPSLKPPPDAALRAGAPHGLPRQRLVRSAVSANPSTVGRSQAWCRRNEGRSNPFSRARCGLFFVHRRFSLATGPHRWFRPTALPTSGGTLHTDYDCYDQRRLSATVVIAVIAT